MSRWDHRPDIERGRRILDAEIDENESGERTVRGYLVALLHALWLEGEGFSGKRPLGDSGWESDLINPLVEQGLALDDDDAEIAVIDAIAALGVPA